MAARFGRADSAPRIGPHLTSHCLAGRCTFDATCRPAFTCDDIASSQRRTYQRCAVPLTTEGSAAGAADSRLCRPGTCRTCIPGRTARPSTADFPRPKPPREFAAAHAGKLAELPGGKLAAAIAEYERIEETLGRLMSYAQLLFAGDSTNAAIGRFYQTVNERVTAISSNLLFFALELNRLDDAVLEAKLADPALAHWRPWLRDLRVFRPHQLSDELEKLLHEKEVTGHSAWSRLFDETVAGHAGARGRRGADCQRRTEQAVRRRPRVREAAAHAIGEAFGRNIRLFSLITNTLAKDKEIIDTWRHYPRPGSSRNRANMVEDEVVDALVAAVQAVTRVWRIVITR